MSDLREKRPALSGEMSAASSKSLRWACRRGMLELDMILQTFLREEYGDLSGEQQRRFRQLLAANDQKLFGWLMLGETSEDTEQTALLRQIRRCAARHHFVPKKK